MPASRNARAITFAPRSCPSSPGFAISTRIFFSAISGFSAQHLYSCSNRAVAFLSDLSAFSAFCRSLRPLRLCGKVLLFVFVHKPPKPVLKHDHVEINQQSDLTARQTQVR